MIPGTLLEPISARNGHPASHTSRRCPLCDGVRSKVVYELQDPSGTIEGVFNLRRCEGCDLVYVDPRPRNDALTRLYNQDFYFSTGWSYESLASRVIEFIQGHRRRRIERYVRKGTLLDIGSGDGRFVHHMARRGWDATGIDFSPSALEYARRIKSGGRFRMGSLEDCGFPAHSFDVITMWQVLEHIPEPLPLLRRSYDLLKPGGVFVASVPNFDGWSSRLTRERWWGLDVPRHLVHFTPETLSLSLQRAGFHVVRVRHRSFQYDPYGLLHSSLDWVFTRRHFLSDFAKRHASDGMSHGEFLFNLTALVLLAPVLAPVSLATTSVAALVERGGFIEVHARRE